MRDEVSAARTALAKSDARLAHTQRAFALSDALTAAYGDAVAQNFLRQWASQVVQQRADIGCVDSAAMVLQRASSG